MHKTSFNRRSSRRLLDEKQRSQRPTARRLVVIRGFFAAGKRCAKGRETKEMESTESKCTCTHRSNEKAAPMDHFLKVRNQNLSSFKYIAAIVTAYNARLLDGDLIKRRPRILIRRKDAQESVLQ